MDSCYPIDVIAKPCAQQEVFRVCVFDSPYLPEERVFESKTFGVNLYINSYKKMWRKKLFFLAVLTL